MKKLLLILIPLFSLSMLSQKVITLHECYELAAVNYPLAKQSQLFEIQNELDKDVISKTKLPQLSLDALASYQSDVIEVPIPNAGITPPNKDQYRATLSVHQLIYNGGATDASINVKEAQLKARQKQVEVNLYQIKQKINHLYFSVLLNQQTILLLRNKEELLQSKLKEVKSGINYGLLLPASDKVLEVEILKLNQQFLETESNKASLIQTLSRIIGQPLDSSSSFQTPLLETELKRELNRPELDLFNLKKEEIENKDALMSKQNSPKFLAFVTGGYGNPGLNMLNNSFQPFYVVGVKLNWKVFDWNSNKKLRESLSINKNILDTETETFSLNTNIELNQKQMEIEKIEAFIVSDSEIIKLRNEVLKSADSQLKNGVITASAYITELTNLYEDENTLLKHKIQLQLSKANYNSIQGQ